MPSNFNPLKQMSLKTSLAAVRNLFKTCVLRLTLVGVIFLSLSLRAHAQPANQSCKASFASSLEHSKTPLSGIFSGTSPLSLSISFNLADLRRKAMPNFEQLTGAPVDRDKSFITATVNNYPAQVRARGASSLNAGELDFPKLRIEVDGDAQGEDDFFKGSKKFLINTEGTIIAGRTVSDMGRTLGAQSPIREALNYKLAETVGLETPLNRLARLHFVDLSTQQEHWQWALLLESRAQREKRINARKVEAKEYRALGFPVPKHEVILVSLFQMMIGNLDYFLIGNGETLADFKSDELALFNTEAYLRVDGVAIPMIFDLDLASTTVGPSTYFPTSTEVRRRMRSKLFDFKQRFGEVELRDAFEKIKTHRKKLYALVYESEVDVLGKNWFYTHLDSFFSLENEL